MAHRHDLGVAGTVAVAVMRCVTLSEFAIAHSGFNLMPLDTQKAVRDVGISNPQALIFIVAIVVMIALAVWMGL